MPLQLLVLSAMLFGPLSSWLAARHGRSPIAWLVLGAAAGPAAAVLVAIAPPGSCPRCGSGVRGWPTTCATCGNALTGGLATAPVAATLTDAGGATSGRARGASGATPSTAMTDTAPSRDEVTVVALPPRGAWSEPEPGSRPSEPPAPAVAPAAHRTDEPERIYLADGVFIGGSVRLLIGGRYVVAVEGDDLLFLDPLAKEARLVALRRPRAGLAVTLADDQVIIEEVGGGIAFAAALRRVSVAYGRDLVRDVPLPETPAPVALAVGGSAGPSDGSER